MKSLFFFLKVLESRPINQETKVKLVKSGSVRYSDEYLVAMLRLTIKMSQHVCQLSLYYSSFVVRKVPNYMT
jgi:hypothetical protein